MAYRRGRRGYGRRRRYGGGRRRSGGGLMKGIMNMFKEKQMTDALSDMLENPDQKKLFQQATGHGKVYIDQFGNKTTVRPAKLSDIGKYPVLDPQSKTYHFI